MSGIFFEKNISRGEGLVTQKQILILTAARGAKSPPQKPKYFFKKNRSTVFLDTEPISLYK